MYGPPSGASQFRRPWSPEPFVPYREPSEASVEALDLADYAQTLHRPQPLPQRVTPSLTHGSSSRHSSTTHHSTPARRPFSLPPPSSQGSHYPPTTSSRYPRFTDPRLKNGSAAPHVYQPSEPEIDITQFPSYSTANVNLYDTPTASRSRNSAKFNSPPDPYTSLPHSRNSYPSPWDPSAIHSYNYDDTYDGSFNPYSPSSVGHESTRELLPWSDVPSYPQSSSSHFYGGEPSAIRNSQQRLHPLIKEERLKILEREFGPNSSKMSNKNKQQDFVDEEGKPLIGTVNDKGQLVTQGPKKRMFMRFLQVVLASGAAVPAIYAALVRVHDFTSLCI
jgi:hypothetical protein